MFGPAGLAGSDIKRWGVVVSASVADSDGGDVYGADNRELIETFFTALSQGRYDDAQKLVRPQATWWMLAKRGPVDPAGWFAGFAQLFPAGVQFELEGTTSEGPRIAVRAVARGTTVTGREFDNALHFLFEIEDGLIRAVWEYGDTLHADRVLRG